MESVSLKLELGMHSCFQQTTQGKQKRQQPAHSAEHAKLNTTQRGIGATGGGGGDEDGTKKSKGAIGHDNKNDLAVGLELRRKITFSIIAKTDLSQSKSICAKKLENFTRQNINHFLVLPCG
jgi:hypothetical protein